MSETYLRRTDPTFWTILLLIMSVASVVLIVIRLVFTVTLYATGPVMLASYLFSLILMALSGALLFQKPWALFPLSLAGKGYFILAIALLFIRAENLADAAWLSTGLSSLYLGLLNYLNPVRTHTGQERVTGIFIAARAAAGVLLVSTCLTLYFVLVSNLFPDYIYRSHTREYGDLVASSDSAGFPPSTWSELWRVAVPEQYTALGREVGIGIWTNSEGYRVIVSQGVWSEQVEEYAFMGYTEPYDIDKAVWKAGIAQPFLLVIKMTMSDEDSTAYFLEDPAVKSVIIVGHNENEPSRTWNVTANIYIPGGRPYSIESAGRTLEGTLLPIQMTLYRLGHEG